MFRKLVKEYALELLLGLCSLLCLAQFFLLTAGFWSRVHWLRVGADCLAAAILFVGVRNSQALWKKHRRKPRISIEKNVGTFRGSSYDTPPQVVPSESLDVLAAAVGGGATAPLLPEPDIDTVDHIKLARLYLDRVTSQELPPVYTQDGTPEEARQALQASRTDLAKLLAEAAEARGGHRQPKIRRQRRPRGAVTNQRRRR